MKLSRKFFERNALVVAKDIIGKVLVRKVNGKLIKAKIVESEAYVGDIDKACHAYGGRRTERTEPLYGKPGIAYVYFIYGMYYCFNVITGKEGKAEGVLIRAVQPLEGIEEMSINRYKEEFENLNNYKRKNLTNGPSKLAMAFNITKQDSWTDLSNNKDFYIEDNKENKQIFIVEDKRIGIDYAEEAKDFLWRFYEKNNPYVSKK